MFEAPQHKIEEWIILFVASDPTPPNCVRQRNIFISTSKKQSAAVMKYAAKWEGYLQAQTEMFMGKSKSKTVQIDDESDPTTQTIFKIIREQLGLSSKTEITRASHLIKDLGADSLDLVELVMAVEDELRIEIPDAPLDRDTTNGKIFIVGNFVDVVKSFITER
jgi:acyl carrier protein